MFYQLIHHDKANSSTFVAQSPDLRTQKEADEWFADETRHRKLPEGRFWGLIDEKHIAYTKQLPVASSELTFEQILLAQKEVWKKDIEERSSYAMRLAEHMAKFQG